MLRRKKRQCSAALTERRGARASTFYCTRLRHDDPFHANAIEQMAWIEVRAGKQVTYQWPYEHLADDTVLEVKGVRAPIYHRESADAHQEA